MYAKYSTEVWVQTVQCTKSTVRKFECRLYSVRKFECRLYSVHKVQYASLSSDCAVYAKYSTEVWVQTVQCTQSTVRKFELRLYSVRKVHYVLEEFYRIFIRLNRNISPLDEQSKVPRVPMCCPLCLEGHLKIRAQSHWPNKGWEVWIYVIALRGVWRPPPPRKRP